MHSDANYSQIVMSLDISEDTLVATALYSKHTIFKKDPQRSTNTALEINTKLTITNVKVLTSYIIYPRSVNHSSLQGMLPHGLERG